MSLDLVVRGAHVVTPEGTAVADVGIEGGVFAEIGPEPAAAREEIDGTGLVALPGVVDAHVHLNDPGRAEWEGFATGTAALAAGGTTTFADMPLNAHPPTIDAGAFDAKVAAATGNLRADLALWGGLVGGHDPNPDRLDELAERGVVGFKAFMSDSGIDDFAAADDDTLRAGMARAAALGLPVAVHAESQAMTSARAEAAVAAGRVSFGDYLDSRPIEAEVEAIVRALRIAEETGCALHVVHVSSAAGVVAVAQARARGVDATCETCPHYLALDREHAEQLGAVAKCAPPVRGVGEVLALWERLRAGEIDLVATDHSPSPASMKTGDDAFAWWGGISGAQTLLALMWDIGLDPDALARLLAAAPARRLGLQAKGAIAVGNDADLVLVDPAGSWTVSAETLRDRHRLSPFVGRTLRGRVVRTILRGRTVAVDGVEVGEPSGRVLRRQGGTASA